MDPPEVIVSLTDNEHNLEDAQTAVVLRKKSSTDNTEHRYSKVMVEYVPWESAQDIQTDGVKKDDNGVVEKGQHNTAAGVLLQRSQLQGAPSIEDTLLQESLRTEKVNQTVSTSSMSKFDMNCYRNSTQSKWNEDNSTSVVQKELKTEIKELTTVLSSKKSNTFIESKDIKMDIKDGNIHDLIGSGVCSISRTQHQEGSEKQSLLELQSSCQQSPQVERKSQTDLPISTLTEIYKDAFAEQNSHSFIKCVEERKSRHYESSSTFRETDTLYQACKREDKQKASNGNSDKDTDDESSYDQRHKQDCSENESGKLISKENISNISIKSESHVSEEIKRVSQSMISMKQLEGKELPTDNSTSKFPSTDSSTSELTSTDCSVDEYPTIECTTSELALTECASSEINSNVYVAKQKPSNDSATNELHSTDCEGLKEEMTEVMVEMLQNISTDVQDDVSIEKDSFKISSESLRGTQETDIKPNKEEKHVKMESLHVNGAQNECYASESEEKESRYQKPKAKPRSGSKIQGGLLAFRNQLVQDETRPTTSFCREFEKLRLKIVLVGDSQSMCGLLEGFATKKSSRNTLLSRHEKDFEVESDTYSVSVVSLSSPDVQVDVRHKIFQGADIVIVCFSLENNESFSRLSSQWVPEVKSNTRNVPALLLGTITTEESTNKHHSPSGSKLKKIKKDLKAVKYLTCNTCDKDQVKHVYEEAIRVIIKKIEFKGSKSICTLC